MDTQDQTLNNTDFEFHGITIRGISEWHRYTDLLHSIESVAQQMKSNASITNVVASGKHTIVSTIPLKADDCFFGCVIDQKGNISFGYYKDDKIQRLSLDQLRKLCKRKRLWVNLMSRIQNRAEELDIGHKGIPNDPSRKFVNAWKEKMDTDKTPQFFNIKDLNLTDGVRTFEDLDRWKQNEKPDIFHMTEAGRKDYYEKKAADYNKKRSADHALKQSREGTVK